MICPTIVGKAKRKIAPDTLLFSNSSHSFVAFTRVTPFPAVFGKKTRSQPLRGLPLVFFSAQCPLHMGSCAKKQEKYARFPPV